MMNKIRIFDTTLRDGEQGIGNLMSLEQKSAILEQLNFLDLDIIEIGFPAASQEDEDWVFQASSLPLKALPAIFSRLLEEDIKTAIRASRNYSDYQIQLLGIGSEIHLKEKRKISLEQALKEIEKATCLIQAHGLKNIAIIFEDATRGSLDFLKRSIDKALECGISTVTLADTLGCCTPIEISTLFLNLKKTFGASLTLGVHCHNDLGLATINTLSACYAGATEIQTTIGGIGERAGNCSLEEIMAILLYKKEVYNSYTSIDPVISNQVCNAVYQILLKQIPENKPIVGKYVFSTAAGLHQNGIIKSRSNYEYVEAEKFGRKIDFFFNRISSNKSIKLLLGKKNLQDKVFNNFYERLIIEKSSLTLDEIIKKFDSFLEESGV